MRSAFPCACAHDSHLSTGCCSTDHGCFTVMLPYDKGATTIQVDNNKLLDVLDASPDNCFLLVNVATKGHIFVTGVKDEIYLTVQPTTEAGGLGNQIIYCKSSVRQSLLGQQPIYRRNVCNYMPSVRFSPPQMLTMDLNSLLHHRMSGPVDATNFVFFFVAKTYSSIGTSPWPLFTAVDTENNWHYSVQAVMEQRDNTNLEARWKIFGGKVSPPALTPVVQLVPCARKLTLSMSPCRSQGSEKTDGIDPTRFHILTVVKKGRLMQLFVDGCKGASPPRNSVLAYARAENDCSDRFTR